MKRMMFKGGWPMSTTFDVQELAARLGEAMAILSSGGEVLLTEGNIPRARLIPCGKSGPRLPGLHAGAIQTASDFDAPLPDDFWAGQQ
jgi:antitoxin (DNA-binding transcriptional repressor) of toxin-antitoxin stability system